MSEAAPAPQRVDGAPPVAIGVRGLVVGFGEKLVMKGLDLDVMRGEVMVEVTKDGLALIAAINVWSVRTLRIVERAASHEAKTVLNDGRTGNDEQEVQKS